MPDGENVMAGIGCIAIVGYLLFWGFVAWAVIHFAMKFW
jgi:hypothetical protein